METALFKSASKPKYMHCSISCCSNLGFSTLLKDTLTQRVQQNSNYLDHGPLSHSVTDADLYGPATVLKDL